MTDLEKVQLAAYRLANEYILKGEGSAIYTSIGQAFRTFAEQLTSLTRYDHVPNAEDE